MVIKQIIHQRRRDFKCIYECEHCGNEEKGAGYDDANFHKNVIPNFQCENCGEKANSSYEPRTTKYEEGFQI